MHTKPLSIQQVGTLFAVIAGILRAMSRFATMLPCLNPASNVVSMSVPLSIVPQRDSMAQACHYAVHCCSLVQPCSHGILDASLEVQHAMHRIQLMYAYMLGQLFRS